MFKVDKGAAPVKPYGAYNDANGASLNDACRNSINGRINNANEALSHRNISLPSEKSMNRYVRKRVTSEVSSQKPLSVSSKDPSVVKDKIHQRIWMKMRK